MSIATYEARPNTPLVYYWGKLDEELFLPTRSSFSVTIEGINYPLKVKTTVDATKDYSRDEIFIYGEKGLTKPNEDVENEIRRQLAILKHYAETPKGVRVVSYSTFPMGAGLAGSAAEAASLALAFFDAVQYNPSERILNQAVRQLSGSGTRSLYGGFVKWDKGESSEDSIAKQIFDENYWPDFRILVAVVEEGKKKVPSRLGMKTTVQTCPPELYKFFCDVSEIHINEMIESIKNRDLKRLGELYELENQIFRTVCLYSKPSLDYYSPATHRVFEMVKELRDYDIDVYAGTQAGPNVNLLTDVRNLERVRSKLESQLYVKRLYVCKPGPGPKKIDDHLI